MLKNLLKVTLWTDDANWTYIKRSEHVLGAIWTSYVLSIYVLCPGDNKGYLGKVLIQWVQFPNNLLFPKSISTYILL